MLQREVRHTIGKGHIPEGAVDARVAEGHGEAEALIRFPGVARHGLGDGQASGIRRRHIPGVGKRCMDGVALGDLARIAGLGSRVTLLGVVVFLHLVGDSRRQTGCGLALAVAQRETRHTVLELHIAICAGDASVTQRDGEVEVLVLVTRVAFDGLRDTQIAKLQLSLVVREQRIGRCIGLDPSADGAGRRFHVPTIFPYLGNLPLRAHRQAENRQRFVMAQGKRAAVGDVAGALLAVVVIAALKRRPVSIFQRHAEGEVLGVVGICHAVTGDDLADAQLPCGVVRFILRVGHHDGIQQAEQAGDVPAFQVVPVGGVVAVIGTVALQRRGVLYHARAQEAFVRGEERVDVLPAILVMQAVIHHRVHTVVQVHAPRDIRPFEQVVLPAVHLERIGLLRLGDCGNVAQRDVDHVIGGVLGHGLHQFTNAGHDGDAIVLGTSISVDGIDAHHNWDLRFVQGIACWRRCFFQRVFRAHFRPCHLGITVLFTRVRPEDQHAVLAVHVGGRTRNGRAILGGKGEGHAVDALAVLVDLLNAQLAALVGDVDDRAELALELIGVQEREIAPAKVARDAELGHNVLNHLVGGLSRLLSSLDRIGNIALKAVVELLGGVALDTELPQCTGLDDAVDHLHVALAVVQQITVRAPRKVLQQALELPGVLVVDKAPLGPALVACLVQSGLQHSFAPRLGLALCWGYGAVALRVASVERLPLSVVSHFVVGHVPFQQHGHGDNESRFFTFRTKLSAA